MFFQSQWIALIPLNFFLHKIRPVAWPWCCQEDPSIWLESALRESLFHQNLPLGVRLMRAVDLSWGETCPSLLTRVSCWVSEVSAPSCPPPWGTVWLKLCWAWLLSESFSRHPSVVQSLPSNSQGSLEHSLLFFSFCFFSSRSQGGSFRLLSYLEAPNFPYLLSYYKVRNKHGQDIRVKKNVLTSVARENTGVISKAMLSNKGRVGVFLKEPTHVPIGKQFRGSNMPAHTL